MNYSVETSGSESTEGDQSVVISGISGLVCESQYSTASLLRQSVREARIVRIQQRLCSQQIYVNIS